MFSAAFVSTILFFILLLLRRLIWLHLQRLLIDRPATAAVEQVLNPPNTSTRDLLVSRALSNDRLIRAFALTNTFVSSDVDIHTAFVRRAKSLIKGAKERGWVHFQDIADSSVEVALPHAGKRDFDAFVQEVTMRVALVAILDIDITVDLDSEDIHVVSSLITLLWSLSKKPDPIPPDLLPRLNDHLRRLVPDDKSYPNPLDFVIPIWETMWRVVATTVAYARDSSESYVLAELHRSPLPAQFSRFDGTHPSAESFVTEVMRLHPPSQRIARAFPLYTFLPLSFVKLVTKLFGPLLRREKADIGKVLRSECTWGVDVDAFEPLRFHPSRLTPEQEMIKSLPFGYGRFKCVAASWAPMAAGIISAAILNRVQSGSQFSLVAGQSIGGREGWDGWSVVVAPTSRSSESM